jgi:HSP20 family protein
VLVHRLSFLSEKLLAAVGRALTHVKVARAATHNMKASFQPEATVANIARYNPFEDFFSDFGKGFWVRPFAFPEETELKMKIDVKEDEKSFTVKADIPGVKKEDIQIDVDGDRVSLRSEAKQEKEEKKGEKVVYSERTYGMVSRSFTLPADVDAKDAKAEYKDGVLSLTLSKKPGGAAKRIPIA